MELILINDNKLKISLSDLDLKQYALDCNNINYDCTETRRAFWSILDEAKQKTGFDAASQKVFVQLYPSKDGGSEMFVTKLGPLPASAEQSLKRSRGVGVFLRGTQIYFTKHFSSLVSIARAIGADTVERSRVYYEEEQGYYLFLEERGGGGALSPLLPVLEFADPIPGSMRPYIEEYASLMMEENALATLQNSPASQ